MTSEFSLVNDQDMHGGAIFSEDRAHRYYLHREWDRDASTITFCMLNPSTADERKNDPTVERCERFARRWGYGRLIVVNIFALCSTDPRVLYDTPKDQAIGFPSNDSFIEIAATEARTVIVAWGTHGALHGRGQEVLRWMRGRGLIWHAFGLVSNGEPRHPLYLSNDASTRPYDDLYREREEA